MKSNLNKIILNFIIISLLSSCHTLEHKNIFLKTVKKNQKQEIITIKEKHTQSKSKKIVTKYKIILFRFDFINDIHKYCLLLSLIKNYF